MDNPTPAHCTLTIAIHDQSVRLSFCHFSFFFHFLLHLGRRCGARCSQHGKRSLQPSDPRHSICPTRKQPHSMSPLVASSIQISSFPFHLPYQGPKRGLPMGLAMDDEDEAHEQQDGAEGDLEQHDGAHGHDEDEEDDDELHRRRAARPPTEVRIGSLLVFPLFPLSFQ